MLLILPAAQHRNEPAVAAKRDVAGLAGLPGLPGGLQQILRGTDGVDRKLQREPSIGRAGQLIVDDPERAVGQQVDPVGLPPQSDCAGFAAAPDLEFIVQVMFEQTRFDRCLPLGLDLEHCFRETFIRRRSEQPRLLHCRFVIRKRGEQRLDRLAEHRSRLDKIFRRNRALSHAAPSIEKCFEHFVHENPELFRRHARFVFGVFLQSQHAFSEIAKRALEITLQRADRVGGRMVSARLSTKPTV